MIDNLSMNIRGLGADPKFLGLKDLFLSSNSKMFLIQETMHDSFQCISYFRHMLPPWNIVATSAAGLSGSLAVIWDPKWIKAVAFKCFADSLIIGGDFNSTLCIDKTWGNGRKFDPIGHMIREAIIQNNLIDVIPSCRGPTWDNGRSNDSYLEKRLDRFLTHENIIERFGLPSMKIIPSYISDHRPIFIQWKRCGCRFEYPFKFNRTWLTDEGFNQFIMDSWQPQNGPTQ
eukprot:PITA_10780